MLSTCYIAERCSYKCRVYPLKHFDAVAMMCKQGRAQLRQKT